MRRYSLSLNKTCIAPPTRRILYPHSTRIFFMNIDFWAQLCNASTSRPVSQLTEASKIANGVSVSRSALPGRHAPRSHCLQILLFTLGAVLCAAFFLLDYRLLLWRLRGKDFEVEGDMIWKNLRRFSGWTFAGFVSGVITFSLNIRYQDLRYSSTEAHITRQQSYELRASGVRYQAAVQVVHPKSISCVSFTP